jgi:hypothetical protein
LIRKLAMASDRHPLLDNFNVFDRFNIARRKKTRAQENLPRAYA